MGDSLYLVMIEWCRRTLRPSHRRPPRDEARPLPARRLLRPGRLDQRLPLHRRCLPRGDPEGTEGTRRIIKPNTDTERELRTARCKLPFFRPNRA